MLLNERLEEFKEIPEEIHDLIQDQYLERAAKIKSIIEEIGNEFYNFTNDEIKVAFRVSQIPSRHLHENSMNPEDYLSALEVLGEYECFIRQLTPKMVDGWIPKIFNSDVSIKNAQGFSILSFNRLEKEMNLSDVVDSFIKFADYVSNSIFTPEKRPTDDFVDKWSASISNHLQQIFVLNGKELTKENIEDVKRLEIALMTLDMLSPQFFPLVDAVVYEEKRIRSQKQEILATAKEILESNDSNTCEINQGTIRGIALLKRRSYWPWGKSRIKRKGWKRRSRSKF
jgi:hypothetical protein